MLMEYIYDKHTLKCSLWKYTFSSGKHPNSIWFWSCSKCIDLTKTMLSKCMDHLIRTQICKGNANVDSWSLHFKLSQYEL